MDKRRRRRRRREEKRGKKRRNNGHASDISRSESRCAVRPRAKQVAESARSVAIL